MEHKDSLPCSQEPTTGPYPEPDATAHTFSLSFPKIHSNIIFASIRRSSKWSLHWILKFFLTKNRSSIKLLWKWKHFKSSPF